MAAITKIPYMLKGVDGDFRSKKFQAGAAITKGTVLSLNSTGQAIPYPATTTLGVVSPCVGVAFADAAIGESVAAIYEGVVAVANADDTTAIAIGSAVKVGTFSGAVIATVTMTDTMIVGQVCETAIAGGSYGFIMLKLR